MRAKERCSSPLVDIQEQERNYTKHALQVHKIRSSGPRSNLIAERASTPTPKHIEQAMLSKQQLRQKAMERAEYLLTIITEETPPSRVGASAFSSKRSRTDWKAALSGRSDDDMSQHFFLTQQHLKKGRLAQTPPRPQLNEKSFYEQRDEEFRANAGQWTTDVAKQKREQRISRTSDGRIRQGSPTVLVKPNTMLPARPLNARSGRNMYGRRRWSGDDEMEEGFDVKDSYEESDEEAIVIDAANSRPETPSAKSQGSVDEAETAPSRKTAKKEGPPASPGEPSARSKRSRVVPEATWERWNEKNVSEFQRKLRRVNSGRAGTSEQARLGVRGRKSPVKSAVFGPKNGKAPRVGLRSSEEQTTDSSLLLMNVDGMAIYEEESENEMKASGRRVSGRASSRKSSQRLNDGEADSEDEMTSDRKRRSRPTSPAGSQAGSRKSSPSRIHSTRGDSDGERQSSARSKVDKEKAKQERLATLKRLGIIKSDSYSDYTDDEEVVVEPRRKPSPKRHPSPTTSQSQSESPRSRKGKKGDVSEADDEKTTGHKKRRSSPSKRSSSPKKHGNDEIDGDDSDAGTRRRSRSPSRNKSKDKRKRSAKQQNDETDVTEVSTTGRSETDEESPTKKRSRSTKSRRESPKGTSRRSPTRTQMETSEVTLTSEASPAMAKSDTDVESSRKRKSSPKRRSSPSKHSKSRKREHETDEGSPRPHKRRSSPKHHKTRNENDDAQTDDSRHENKKSRKRGRSPSRRTRVASESDYDYDYSYSYSYSDEYESEASKSVSKRSDNSKRTESPGKQLESFSYYYYSYGYYSSDENEEKLPKSEDAESTTDQGRYLSSRDIVESTSFAEAKLEDNGKLPDGKGRKRSNTFHGKEMALALKEVVQGNDKSLSQRPMVASENGKYEIDDNSKITNNGGEEGSDSTPDQPDESATDHEGVRKRDRESARQETGRSQRALSQRSKNQMSQNERDFYADASDNDAEHVSWRPTTLNKAQESTGTESATQSPTRRRHRSRRHGDTSPGNESLSESSDSEDDRHRRHRAHSRRGSTRKHKHRSGHDDETKTRRHRSRRDKDEEKHHHRHRHRSTKRDKAEDNAEEESLKNKAAVEQAAESKIEQSARDNANVDGTNKRRYRHRSRHHHHANDQNVSRGQRDAYANHKSRRRKIRPGESTPESKRQASPDRNREPGQSIEPGSSRSIAQGSVQDVKQESARSAKQESARDGKQESARSTRQESARDIKQESARSAKQESARDGRQESARSTRQESARSFRQESSRSKGRLDSDGQTIEGENAPEADNVSISRHNFDVPFKMPVLDSRTVLRRNFRTRTYAIETRIEYTQAPTGAFMNAHRQSITYDSTASSFRRTYSPQPRSRLTMQTPTSGSRVRRDPKFIFGQGPSNWSMQTSTDSPLVQDIGVMYHRFIDSLRIDEDTDLPMARTPPKEDFSHEDLGDLAVLGVPGLLNMRSVDRALQAAPDHNNGLRARLVATDRQIRTRERAANLSPTTRVRFF